MSPRLLFLAGAAILVFAWAGPLPGLVPGSFAAHMMLHMTVVGIGIPVLAFGLAPFLRTSTASDPLPLAGRRQGWGWRAWPEPTQTSGSRARTQHRDAGRRRAADSGRMILTIVASLIDLVVVWLWHVPALHHASRMEFSALALEQLSFAAVALLVWLVALTGPPLAGALTLFFTSMHMTLLGALLSLTPRVIYEGHGSGGWVNLAPLADQQLGGVIMLAIGGVIYLGGGLALVARVLRPVRA